MNITIIDCGSGNLRSVQKAFEKVEGRDLKEFDSTLKGGTSIMFSEVGNAPAKLIKEFRKKGDKPILKGAYVDESIFIGDSELDSLDGNLISAIITPDKDIIPDAEKLNPAYVVFDNYEIILKWNRSLRFALAVCTLKNEFKNDI